VGSMGKESAGTVGPVVDMTRSPFCTLRPVPVNSVRLHDTFWEPRVRTNREVTIPSQLQHCEATGRIDNFRRASGARSVEFQGIYFNDSDVYKWVEAAAWSLAGKPDLRLEADLDRVIAEVAAAQQPNGYLNTYFMFERESERFTNLKDMHEIYCAGHLFQAAAAHFRATGTRTLLTVACRLADHLHDVFGPGGRAGACGHEEAEMGLVELFRITGERRYLELARRMIEVRGAKPPVLGGSPYHQDHLPFTEQSEMVGHAVRHLYLCCGSADVVAETGDAAYLHALDTLWQNFTQRKMYVTGGAGSRWEGEAFGEDYELPNERAYTETWAGIGSVMWNWRMLQITGLPQFADVMEMALYNAVLPGLSLDGASYFYQNPLSDRGKHRRQEWFGCACCPPNVARLLASLTGYFYSTGPDAVYVHLYAESTAEIALGPTDSMTIRQETDYPWSGDITLHFERVVDREVTVNLRMPFWADEEETLLFINGVDATEYLLGEAGRYRAITRRWEAGDRIRLMLPMPVEWIESHPQVTSNHGRVALQRGPLIYCVEQVDHPDADVWDLALPDDADLTLDQMDIGGRSVIALRGEAVARESEEWQGSLYAPYRGPDGAEYRSVPVTAIPYYAWANRDAGPMAVWLPVKQAT
jgi:DUF1680 family protein